ncbi:HNH endonuclease family protein [Mycetocola zhujimingii]|uniref:HNH endonuclease family protein n=1 Tax=Mycetocola zhujimingii TaxID=2079792 RepID=UPI000D34574D|nr:HNH endonuclease family protein [Mycetocola zhujimingii]AWB85706.1 HNH endonuclease [Mycetocola zhujimingii]
MGQRSTPRASTLVGALVALTAAIALVVSILNPQDAPPATLPSTSQTPIPGEPTDEGTASGTGGTGPMASVPIVGTASETLAALPTKGRAPKTGYDRTDSFGRAWIDVDGNGCDTRNDILARDLTEILLEGDCRVMAGSLDNIYGGIDVEFTRGQDTSTAVQVDHVVALMNAWETGAQQLSQAQREALANDPLNLQATDASSNGQKQAGDAATWLPPAHSYRCEYVARQVSVKAVYQLWVTAAERAAIEGVLATCPGQPAYGSTLVPVAR